MVQEGAGTLVTLAILDVALGARVSPSRKIGGLEVVTNKVVIEIFMAVTVKGVGIAVVVTVITPTVLLTQVEPGVLVTGPDVAFEASVLEVAKLCVVVALL